MSVPLDDADLVRYARQIVLREVGPAGQRRLRDASVAVVGAGGLGAPVLAYLAAAGVGRITVIDDDRVALDNLQRQVLFDERAVGESKARIAARRLRPLNSGVSTVIHEGRLDADNARALLAGHDAVVEASDNLTTKFAVNDACVGMGVVAVIGAVLRFEGQVVVDTPGRPCYRCLFGAEPQGDLLPACSAAGVLGPVAGMVGSLQASETLRALLGIGEDQGGRLLAVEALRPRMRTVRFERDPACAACAQVVAGAPA